MSKTRAAFLHSPELERHVYPEDCPFDTRRAGLVRKTIFNMGLLGGPDRREVQPERADEPDLLKYHTADYLEAIKRAEAGELTPEAFAMGLGNPDNPIFKGLWEHTTWAVGASLTGATMILNGEADVAFNPSGGFHHAAAERASGFCYINDVALAAIRLTESGKKTLILDLDVHHGDGVQEAFYHSSDVMFISMHEDGKVLFPGTGDVRETGAGEGEGYTVNIPLPVGTHDEAYLRVYDQLVPPLIKAFDPDTIIMQLGMDGLANDPLAHLNLTNNVYADVIESIRALNRPVLATGGGGYHVKNTVRGWALAWSVLCGEQDHDLGMGMGGVMLENVDWSGGLRDRIIPADARHLESINVEIDLVVKKIKSTIFPLHGLA